MKKTTQSILLTVALLTLGSLSAFAQPGAAAPTPTVPAVKAVSIFSDAYTNAAGGTNFNPGWGQATVQSIIQVGTDNVLKYANLNYQGTEFGNHVNVADMKFMHVDVFTADETVFQITPISPGKEFLYTVPTLNQNSWNSYNIPLTAFAAGNIVWSDLFQIKVVGSGGKTVYLDNIYFYTDAANDIQAPTAFTAAKGVVASDAVELLLNATDNSGAVFFDITYNSTTVSTSAASGVQKSFSISGLNGSTDYSFSVVAKDRTGNAVAAPIVVSATTLSALPAAPTPTTAAAKVISIFSDTYTSVAGTNFYPGWGQSTQASSVSLAGNNTMKYTNFNYQGIELGSHVDASGMNKLHVDIYPIDETSVRLTPISPGKELPTSLGALTANQWNSFDIPLTTYAAGNIVWSDIFQFKLDGGTNKTFYMDNLYFYNDATGLNDIADNHVVSCYVQNKNNLIVSSQTELKSVTLLSLTGQLIKSVKASGLEKNIDITTFTSGNYLVSVQLVNGLVSTHKFVKL